ncbi:Coiled-coil domain-containing protein 40 [Thoreauomyces humboldtii]|nr:Coiled-coil domain-containing protein 40 [Thoreauomyces humboldtii]
MSDSEHETREDGQPEEMDVKQAEEETAQDAPDGTSQQESSAQTTSFDPSNLPVEAVLKEEIMADSVDTDVIPQSFDEAAASGNAGAKELNVSPETLAAETTALASMPNAEQEGLSVTSRADEPSATAPANLPGPYHDAAPVAKAPATSEDLAAKMPVDTARFPELPPLPTRTITPTLPEPVVNSAWSHKTPVAPHVTFEAPENELYDSHSVMEPGAVPSLDQQHTDEAIPAAAEESLENEAIMDPDNPLMERVQAALYKQLAEQRGKVQLELREKEEAVRVTVSRREAIGVELYALQQQLARQQAMLEETQDNLGVIRGFREEAERGLKQANSLWKEHKEKADHHAKNLDHQKQELEKISRTVKQVDLYNEQLRSKILVAKRTTMKAEEDLVKQEQDKKRQDYFIDHLTDQLRRLQERRALFETQLMAQQRETKAALETLQDAATEMEAIQFEKKQLVHQWKSSLIGLQRREEVIQQIDEGIQKNKNTILSMNGEVSGFRLSLRKAQEQNETLTVLLNKLEGEVNHLKRDIAGITEQKDKLKESYTMYTRSLEQTEGELSTVMQERLALQTELAAVQKQTRMTSLVTQKLSDEIAEHLQSQLSISKGAQGTKKDNGKLRVAIHEKESTIAQVQNDLGNIRLETLNVTARIRGTKEGIGKLDKELAERNGLVEKYELEIRRRNDELGKKQGEVDLLNKKYDQLTAKNQDESMGPLEATIHNLSKLVSQKEKECMHLSQFWLRSQNELVTLTKRTGEVADVTQELRMQLTVLNRKKMVVNSAFDTELKEIREHQRNIRQLQHDMVKINTLLTRHAVVQNKLEENNLDLEQEFRAKLKDAELESLHLEQNVIDLKSEKQRALQGLIEAERQMMLWEKKIQLARETQAALDPNIGATEIREMEAEIHRMRLRHASMLKLQEKMIAEMEKSVYRRESIATRTKTKGKGGGQLSLQNAIADLTKKIRTTLGDLRECDQDVGTLQNLHESLDVQLQDATHSISGLDAKEQQLMGEIETCMRRKELIANQTLLQQRQARRYRDFQEGKYTFLVKDAEQRDPEWDSQRDRLQKIDMVLRHVEEEYGQTFKANCEPIHEFLAAGLAAR